jgi:hypothetical protein
LHSPTMYVSLSLLGPRSPSLPSRTAITSTLYERQPVLLHVFLEGLVVGLARALGLHHLGGQRDARALVQRLRTAHTQHARAQRSAWCNEGGQEEELWPMQWTGLDMTYTGIKKAIWVWPSHCVPARGANRRVPRHFSGFARRSPRSAARRRSCSPPGCGPGAAGPRAARRPRSSARGCGRRRLGRSSMETERWGA